MIAKSEIRNPKSEIRARLRNRYGRRGLPAAVVALWWADFQRLGYLAAVGRRHGRTATAISDALAKHGYRPKDPPPKNFAVRGRDNRFVRVKRRFTPAQLRRLMDACDKVYIPPALRMEWREWPAARRRWWTRTLQRRIDRRHPERALPAGPLSPGLERFDFWSPRARALAATANGDRPSREWTVHLRLSSRGLIHRDQLWYYSWDDGSYYQGPFRRGIGRPALHQVIWSEAHGPLPRGHVLRFRDGNRHNFRVANLELVPRAALLSESRQKFFRAKARADTALLLAASQRKTKHAHDKLVRSLVAGG